MSERFNLVKNEEKCDLSFEQTPEQQLCEWRSSGFFWGGKPFIPLIGEGPSCNVAAIALDAGYTASLDFSNALKNAEKAIQEGKKLFWQIDLELFGDLETLTENTGRHESRLLALDHFLEKCYAKFKEATFGLCLYQGPADFRKGFKQQSTRAADLFSLREIAAEYLSLLTGRLPDELLIFLTLDAEGLKESELLQALNLELFERFLFAVKNSSSHFYALTWEKGAPSYGGLDLTSSLETIAPKIGFCLPGKDFISEKNLEFLEKALRRIKSHEGAYRLLPESRITAYWDELDKLCAIEGSLSFSGQRQLQGFLAAGGELVLL